MTHSSDPVEREQIERLVNASYTELRPVVERYRDDGTGLVRSWASADEWGAAIRTAGWFQSQLASLLNLESDRPMAEHTSVTVEDMDNLRHMLGVSERTPRGYRNYFVAGGKDVDSMERLRAGGLVVKNERYRLSADPCYHATIDGARFLGLKKLPE